MTLLVKGLYPQETYISAGKGIRPVTKVSPVLIPAQACIVIVSLDKTQPKLPMYTSVGVTVGVCREHGCRMAATLTPECDKGLNEQCRTFLKVFKHLEKVI